MYIELRNLSNKSNGGILNMSENMKLVFDKLKEQDLEEVAQLYYT